MIKYLLAFSCILLPMSAEKRIEYVGAKDGDRLTAVLQTKGIHTKVVNAEWETLSKGLKKESSRFGKLKRKLIGEKKVALDQEIECCGQKTDGTRTDPVGTRKPNNSLQGRPELSRKE